MFPKDELDQLVQKFETSQRKSRQRALIAIAIPTIAATAYLGLTLVLIVQAKNKLSDLQAERQTVEQELQRAKQQLAQQQQEIQSRDTVIQQISPRSDYTNPNRSLSAPLSTAPAPEVVYIQIRSTSQREKAQAIATALQSKGYVIPRIEQVTIGPSKTSQVRYFRPEDQEKAVQLVKILQALQVQDPIKPSLTATDRANIKHLEIWFSPNF